MANPRSLVYALYTHWDTVELLVRLSREFAVLTSDQVLNGIAKVSGQRDAETQGAVLRALVNADILQTLPRSSDLQLNAYVLEFVRGLTLLYYGGQLDGRLLAWLGQRPRASRVVLFPDYDGVGLANFARLFAQLGDTCECWLMPDWQSKLARYGSQRLWQDTLREFTSAVLQLPDYLGPLTEQMRQSGLALEQEAVWLSVR